ncbi:MAG: 16S rRNA (cytidine(1402)-2'-O)-methyltransferase [Candidatus Pacebacteria bacterium]|nr:16S rRNA (cytidine(1402)-2'-O)-methyltransferase [Candidatus Paceibacterota bacterium]MBP9832225.1 16S rRNA (cytidine(1402)-2'-O)-methyltransferase [Candidatus Paceibacterota bacterium]
MAGILYVVATPIGNLQDITLRALSTLKSVTRIVAEDTRVTKKLLDRHDIHVPLFPLHAHSSRAQFDKVVEMVESGQNVAMVTDAGTPGVSDPGALIVRLVREKCGEKSVVPIPGVSAVVTALSGSGIPADEFVFLGFLPHKKGRQKLLDEVVLMKRAVVMYESPHRMEKLMEELVARVPERHVVIAKELTKMFEHIAGGTALEVMERLKNGDISGKGEFVVIIAP